MVKKRFKTLSMPWWWKQYQCRKLQDIESFETCFEVKTVQKFQECKTKTLFNNKPKRLWIMIGWLILLSIFKKRSVTLKLYRVQKISNFFLYNSGCASKKYGETCSILCPKNCLMGRCDIDTGTCLGCVTGYTGQMCTEGNKMKSIFKHLFLSKQKSID